jgi:glycosyltransferase involved in cell wall biosynthesis
VGGTPEVVGDGVNGYLVPPGNPRRLAHRIAGLLGDEEVRLEFGRRGRDRMRSVFTFEAQAAQYVTLFHELGVSRRSRT